MSLEEKDLGWSQLPDEIVALFAKSLDTLSNVICFGAVCRGWRRVVLEGNFFHHTCPSIMFSISMSSMAAYRFHCPFSQVFQDLPVQPESKRTWRVGGSTGGWLVETNNQKMDLVNPLLQKRIQMPLLPTIQNSSIVKAALSHSSRCGSEDFRVMAICNCTSSYLIISALPGDAEWKVASCPQDRYFSDIMYYKEQFLAVTTDGRLTACTESEGRGGLVLSFIIDKPLLPSHRPRKKFYYFGHSEMLLIKSSNGELLCVAKYLVSSKSREITKDGKYWFQVFKLEHKNIAVPSWMEVKSLGEDTLFLSGIASISMAAASSSLCKKNCIYFSTIDDVDSYISIFSMEEMRIVDSLPIPLGQRTEVEDDEHQWVWVWVWDRRI